MVTEQCGIIPFSSWYGIPDGQMLGKFIGDDDIGDTTMIGLPSGKYWNLIQMSSKWRS